MHPYTVHIHNILYTSHTLMWVFGYLGYWGKQTPQIKTTKQKPTFQNFFPKFFPKIFL